CAGLLLARRAIGLPMRAARADFPTARTLGVRADTVILAAVAVSGVLAAAAAVILAVRTPQVTNTTGLNETILVLVGVVVGGVDRLLSATLGGFAIGFATSFVGSELPTPDPNNLGAWPFSTSVYLPSVIFGIVILVLILRPAGL